MVLVPEPIGGKPYTAEAIMKVCELIKLLRAVPDQNATVVIGEGVKPGYG
jgi:hypothetical protein